VTNSRFTFLNSATEPSAQKHEGPAASCTGSRGRTWIRHTFLGLEAVGRVNCLVGAREAPCTGGARARERR
jgi:hypothetical protein